MTDTNTPGAVTALRALYRRLMCENIGMGEAYLQLKCVGVPPTEAEFVADALAASPPNDAPAVDGGDVVLVPKRMTSAMFFAWTGTKIYDEGEPHERYQACYRAMLAAAPAPAVEREAVRESIEACIAGGGKQTDVAPLYAQAIRQLDSRSPEWTRINDAITARWPKGLDRVKKLAWEVV